METILKMLTVSFFSSSFAGLLTPRYLKSFGLYVAEILNYNDQNHGSFRTLNNPHGSHCIAQLCYRWTAFSGVQTGGNTAEHMDEWKSL